MVLCSNPPCVLYLCDVADGSTSGVVQVDSQTTMPYTVLDYTLATQSMRNEGGTTGSAQISHFTSYMMTSSLSPVMLCHFDV